MRSLFIFIQQRYVETQHLDSHIYQTQMFTYLLIGKCTLGLHTCYSKLESTTTPKFCIRVQLQLSKPSMFVKRPLVHGHSGPCTHLVSYFVYWYDYCRMHLYACTMHNMSGASIKVIEASWSARWACPPFRESCCFELLQHVLYFLAVVL